MEAHCCYWIFCQVLCVRRFWKILREVAWNDLRFQALITRAVGQRQFLPSYDKMIDNEETHAQVKQFRSPWRR